MKLQFKQQDFQIEAVKSVVDCFAGQPLKTNRFTLERSKELIRKARQAAAGISVMDFEVENAIGYRNGTIQITDQQLLDNIKIVQSNNDIPVINSLQRPSNDKSGYHFTIEMETGTGKTYTYIRTMYELHKQYGWSKFIIIVPSIAIREGVYKTFQVTQEHFQELYGQKISPFIYNSARPQDIENFASDSRISVMIINTQAFAAKGKDARRIYMELDQFGTRKPIDIIAETSPIIIIDEPQSVEGETTMESMKGFKPLFTLRYSATHKNEYNKVYRLDALDAYNQKLVKKIQVKGINLKGTTGTTGYVYLEQIVLSKDKAPQALIEYEKRSGNGVKRVREKLNKGDNLFVLSDNMPQYQNCIIQEIDGYFNKIVINGSELFAGDAIGDIDEVAFRRIQIRETIISHLEKERELYYQGIKVLSLFFIDSVDKYRCYNDANEPELGEYAKIFEEEYKLINSQYLDLFKAEYNEYLESHPASSVHKAYMPGAYADYLKRDNSEKVHNGYFSVDKKNRLTDPTVKRGSEEADDISAYDLIMKDKERLLSFEEPVRFIFSHSALKEGWDNTNVFQICALKHSEANIRRRQEVGRGMRLCVNRDGVRQDKDTVGEQVHQINKLTVIASESYENFAKGLQSEIAATLKDRPQKVSVELFNERAFYSETGETIKLDKPAAQQLYNHLLVGGIIDPDTNKITDKGKELIAANNVPLPVKLEPFRNNITQLLNTVAGGEPINIDNERENVPLRVNHNFHKKEFQALWEKINLKTIYEVQFDTQKLINDSVTAINAKLVISQRSYEVKVGELKDATKEELENKSGFDVTKTTTKRLGSDIYTETTYDLIGEIVEQTNLKRSTIVEILKKISPAQFIQLRQNPEEFIIRTSKLINEVKAALIINNIVYHKTEERLDAKTIFTNDKTALRQSEILKKHIYDYISTDSKIEAKFAEELENSTEVVVYAKLPKSFYITTPIANYSPDWAIVFDKEKVRHVYFVAETKGSDSSMDLRQIEELKIHCAGKHFETISGGEVKFDVISNYERLLEIVQVK